METSEPAAVELALADGRSVRGAWTRWAERLARPVLEAAADRRLRAVLPPGWVGWRAGQAEVEPLAAVFRTLSGLAPWLELADVPDDERALHGEFVGLGRGALAAVLDPDSPDAFDLQTGDQVVVETAKLAAVVLRAPTALVAEVDDVTRGRIGDALEATRWVRPYRNNWLLFAAVNEAALFSLGRRWDPMRVDYALAQHEQWYAGDGLYADGPGFHLDYYNSLVIHPLLVQILSTLHGRFPAWDDMLARERTRAARHAQQLERMISPEGAIPPLGRSLAYRTGVLHGLADAARLGLLPDGLTPAQVRCAMTAACARLLDAPGTFDGLGFLTKGWAGSQPGVAEVYLCTGSLYLAATVLLPLGLPASDPFWADDPARWTARLAYAGQDFPIDKALKDA